MRETPEVSLVLDESRNIGKEAQPSALLLEWIDQMRIHFETKCELFQTSVRKLISKS